MGLPWGTHFMIYLMKSFNSIHITSSHVTSTFFTSTNLSAHSTTPFFASIQFNFLQFNSLHLNSIQRSPLHHALCHITYMCPHITIVIPPISVHLNSPQLSAPLLT